MKKILVTGGAGFIGSWLVPELNKHGYEVAIADNNLENPPFGCSAKWFPVDLTVSGAFENVVDIFEPDAVVHLAAQVGREFGEDDQIHTIRENAQMTTQVANVCAARGIKLLYASSSEIYGDNDDILVDEYMGPFSLPHNLYGLTKRWGEEVCRLYMNPGDLIVVRLSMPYGPGAPPGRGRRAMDNFLWQAHHRMPIPVHDGAERSWCWVGDTVRGIRMALEANLTEWYEGLPITFNIGRDDDPVSMLVIAQHACSIAGAPESLIDVVAAPQRQTVVKRLDTSRLKLIGWTPGVQLSDGIREVYKWITNFDSDGNWASSNEDYLPHEWIQRYY